MRLNFCFGNLEFLHPEGIPCKTLASLLFLPCIQRAAAQLAFSNISPSSFTALSGFAFSMKSEVVFPARKCFVLNDATKKSLLVVTPPICKFSNAKASLFAASVLVFPLDITFANIGSKSVPTTDPSSIPVSHLASIFSSAW